MVVFLVVVVLVGLAVALYEVASSRRRGAGDTRAQLDALSRVVEPRGRPRGVHADDDPDPGETVDGDDADDADDDDARGGGAAPRP